MRQLTLSFAPRHNPLGSVSVTRDVDVVHPQDPLMNFLRAEEDVAFVAVFPQGSILKCVGELLYRCSQSVPVIAGVDGLKLSSCDPTSGRLIQVTLRKDDMLRYDLRRQEGLRVTLDATSLTQAVASF